MGKKSAVWSHAELPRLHAQTLPSQSYAVLATVTPAVTTTRNLIWAEPKVVVVVTPVVAPVMPKVFRPQKNWFTKVRFPLPFMLAMSQLAAASCAACVPSWLAIRAEAEVKSPKANWQVENRAAKKTKE